MFQIIYQLIHCLPRQQVSHSSTPGYNAISDNITPSQFKLLTIYWKRLDLFDFSNYLYIQAILSSFSFRNSKKRIEKIKSDITGTEKALNNENLRIFKGTHVLHQIMKINEALLLTATGSWGHLNLLCKTDINVKLASAVWGY